MSVRLPAVTRRAMSWSLILASLLLSARGAGGQTAVGVISEQRVGQMPDSAQMSAVMGMSARIRSPASFALSMQKEIGLSAQQVAALEVLVRAQADSERVRMLRLMEQMQTTARAKSHTAAREGFATWTGPVDEAAIRAAACEQSKAQAEILIGMIRDRHAVGELLTTTQQEELDRLQGEMMAGAFKSAAPNK